MATANIELIEVGVPGAPGTGVSSAEKASFAVKTGANVFTSTNEFQANSTAAQIVSSGSNATDRMRVTDTTNKEDEYWNGAKQRGFSDAGVTETYSIDAATGTMQLDGVLQVDGGQIKGEQLWLSWAVDGGGSVLTTGVKHRWLIPYNCQIVSDGTDAWRVGLDQSGSIGFDLWMDTHANYPPTNADRISGTIGSQNPRIVTAIKGSSGTLTGWTINLVKGSWLFVAIDTVSTATFATIALHVKKT